MNIPEITGKTAVVGLIGWPVEHSLSPAMHNAAFARLELDWIYLPLPVQSDAVEQALKGLIAFNFVGGNVTVPHKQAVMRHLDDLSEAARVIGAVNTIHQQNGHLIGSNTDAAGFLNALQEGGCRPQGMRVAVLGAGGSARAVVYALAQARAASVVVINRTVERAAVLVDDMVSLFPGEALSLKPLTQDTFESISPHVDLVINTTSLGMHPDIETCSWPEEIPMPGHAFYYDLVYSPLETVFLARARTAGGTGIDGLGMLVHQGAVAFETWTGQPAPIDVMRQACLNKANIL